MNLDDRSGCSSMPNAWLWHFWLDVIFRIIFNHMFVHVQSEVTGTFLVNKLFITNQDGLWP